MLSEARVAAVYAPLRLASLDASPFAEQKGEDGHNSASLRVVGSRLFRKTKGRNILNYLLLPFDERDITSAPN